MDELNRGLAVFQAIEQQKALELKFDTIMQKLVDIEATLQELKPKTRAKPKAVDSS